MLNQSLIKDLTIDTVAKAKTIYAAGKVAFIKETNAWYSGTDKSQIEIPNKIFQGGGNSFWMIVQGSDDSIPLNTKAVAMTADITAIPTTNTAVPGLTYTVPVDGKYAVTYYLPVERQSSDVGTLLTAAVYVGAVANDDSSLTLYVQGKPFKTMFTKRAVLNLTAGQVVTIVVKTNDSTSSQLPKNSGATMLVEQLPATVSVKVPVVLESANGQTDPTADTDFSVKGVIKGSIYRNTTTNTLWVCMDDTTKAAVWERLATEQKDFDTLTHIVRAVQSDWTVTANADAPFNTLVSSKSGTNTKVSANNTTFTVKAGGRVMVSLNCTTIVTAASYVSMALWNNTTNSAVPHVQTYIPVPATWSSFSYSTILAPSADTTYSWRFTSAPAGFKIGGPTGTQSSISIMELPSNVTVAAKTELQSTQGSGAPTANIDNTVKGVGKGSVYRDITSGEVWVCVDDTTANAQWKKMVTADALPGGKDLIYLEKDLSASNISSAWTALTGGSYTITSSGVYEFHADSTFSTTAVCQTTYMFYKNGNQIAGTARRVDATAASFGYSVHTTFTQKLNTGDIIEVKAIASSGTISGTYAGKMTIKQLPTATYTPIGIEWANATGTVDPITTTDKSVAGVVKGAVYSNTTNGTAFICQDDATSAAKWKKLVTADELPNGTPLKTFDIAMSATAGSGATGSSSAKTITGSSYTIPVDGTYKITCHASIKGSSIGNGMSLGLTLNSAYISNPASEVYVHTKVAGHYEVLSTSTVLALKKDQVIAAVFWGSSANTVDCNGGKMVITQLPTSTYVPVAAQWANATGTTDPVASTDNKVQGVVKGAVYANTTDGTVFVCADDATSAAKWKKLVTKDELPNGTALVSVSLPLSNTTTTTTTGPGSVCNGSTYTVTTTGKYTLSFSAGVSSSAGPGDSLWTGIAKNGVIISNTANYIHSKTGGGHRSITTAETIENLTKGDVITVRFWTSANTMSISSGSLNINQLPSAVYTPVESLWANATGPTDPTTTTDSKVTGVTKGAVYSNTVDGTAFVCQDDAEGAAKWKKLVTKDELPNGTALVTYGSILGTTTSTGTSQTTATVVSGSSWTCSVTGKYEVIYAVSAKTNGGSGNNIYAGTLFNGLASVSTKAIATQNYLQMLTFPVIYNFTKGDTISLVVWGDVSATYTSDGGRVMINQLPTAVYTPVGQEWFNANGTVDPVATTDKTVQGVVKGSVYNNTNAGTAFICKDDATGSAKWKKLVTADELPGGTDLVNIQLTTSGVSLSSYDTTNHGEAPGSVYTATVAGKYSIQYSLPVTTQTNNTITIYVAKNGSQISGTAQSGIAAVATQWCLSLTTSAIVDLAIGDKVSLKFYGSAGTGIALATGIARINQLPQSVYTPVLQNWANAVGSSDPTATTDKTVAGVVKGAVYANTTAGTAFVCADDKANGANWKKLVTKDELPGGTDLTYKEIIFSTTTSTSASTPGTLIGGTEYTITSSGWYNLAAQQLMAVNTSSFAMLGIAKNGTTILTYGYANIPTANANMLVVTGTLVQLVKGDIISLRQWNNGGTTSGGGGNFRIQQLPSSTYAAVGANWTTASGTANPSVSTDSSVQGIFAGGTYRNTTTNQVFICKDATPGKAVWRLVLTQDEIAGMGGTDGLINLSVPLTANAVTGSKVPEATGISYTATKNGKYMVGYSAGVVSYSSGFAKTYVDIAVNGTRVPNTQSITQAANGITTNITNRAPVTLVAGDIVTLRMWVSSDATSGSMILNADSTCALTIEEQAAGMFVASKPETISGAVDPSGSTDKATPGVIKGAVYRNTSTGSIWICIDDAVGKAVWRKLITQNELPGGDVLFYDNAILSGTKFNGGSTPVDSGLTYTIKVPGRYRVQYAAIVSNSIAKEGVITFLAKNGDPIKKSYSRFDSAVGDVRGVVTARTLVDLVEGDIVSVMYGTTGNGIATMYQGTGTDSTLQVEEAPKSQYVPVGAQWITAEGPVDPTVTTDSSVTGIVKGATYRNTTSGKVFICLDNTKGAAQWSRVVTETELQAVSGMLGGATDPNAKTDITVSGVGKGSTYRNTTSGKLFVCLDTSAGAAVWKRIATEDDIKAPATAEGADDPSTTTDITVPNVYKGSLYRNTTTNQVWVCLDASTGVANWKRLATDADVNALGKLINNSTKVGIDTTSTSISNSNVNKYFIRNGGTFTIPTGLTAIGASWTVSNTSAAAMAMTPSVTVQLGKLKVPAGGSVTIICVDTDIVHIIGGID